MRTHLALVLPAAALVFGCQLELGSATTMKGVWHSVQARIELEGPTVIESVIVPCGGEVQPIWESESKEDLCNVYVKYKAISPRGQETAPRRCTPTFWEKSGTGWRAISPVIAGVEQFIRGSKLGFRCEGIPGKGFGCEYEITKVICGPPPIDRRAGRAAPAPKSVTCRKSQRQEEMPDVWNARSNGASTCDVTFKLVAPACRPELIGMRGDSNVGVVTFASGDKAKLVTIRNVNHIKLKCEGDHPRTGDHCEFRLLSTACMKP